MDTIKLLELFSGIQSQERALRQLNIPYESVGVCDCDKDVLVSSAAMRFDLENEITNYNFPSVEIMIEELQQKNIGYDFSHQKHTITSRTPITKLKQYYISDKLLKNLGDISKVERLPRANFVTYSSPCQSFSVAGKLAGAAKTCTKCGHKWDIDFSNPDYNYKCPICGNASLESTTSGLLQEVQRLLSVAYEENELPEYLMLENVRNLVGKKFIGQFDAWIKWLDDIGYNTYWKVLNAKHFGIPQNRERVFAISIRKDIDDGLFKFPEQIPLTTRLKDVLEKNVDEKYYLPDERIEKILNSTFIQEKKRIQMTDVCDTLLARDWKDPKCVPVDGEPQIIQKFGDRGTNQYSVRDYAHTIPANPMSDRGQMVVEPQEPFIVASRGRNPDNPSDRTTGAPTEQRLEPNLSGCTNTITSVQKDNYVCEPQVLRAERTEYGKSIRKQYESGEIKEKIGNMREMKPRTDGVANTITSVQKDNYVAEPIIYDDYNNRISADQEAINTLTSNCGASAERNGVKIIEPVIVEDFYQSREPRVYKETAPTIRSERTGLKVADEIEYPCSTRGRQVASAIRASIYKQGTRNLEENLINGLGYEGIIEQEPQLEFVGGIGDKDWAKDGKKLSRNYPQGSRVYSSDGIASSLTAQGVGGAGGYSGLYAVEEDINLKCLNSKGGRNGVDGLQPSLTDRVYDADGCATACATSTYFMPGYLVSEGVRWRIRKLTSCECWRLMGFTDTDHNRAAAYVSASALYKQAGNSICTCCLVGIFHSLFKNDDDGDYTQYLINFND